MSIHKFPLKSIQKIKQHIRNALALSDGEYAASFANYSGSPDDIPEPDSLDELSGLFSFGGNDDPDSSLINFQNHWLVSTVNPAAALLKLPGVWLHPEFRLVSYLYRSNQHGDGAVWAVPESMSTTAQLEKVLVASDDITQAPMPEGALLHFMEAIEGDRSPASFLIASILYRELEEFGALGSYCKWTHHRLIDSIPGKVNWQWRDAQPNDFSPKVKILPDGQAVVEFFSCRIVAPVGLYRHFDHYAAEHYKAQKQDKLIAIGHRAT